MQAKWQNKRKPAAVESNETTESMEVGEGEGAVAEGGLEGGEKARVGTGGWGGALEGV